MRSLIIAAALIASAPLAAQAPGGSAQSAPTAAATPANPATTPPDEAKALVKGYAERLLGELQTALKSGGPKVAIPVCKERAPAIAADLSAASGWEVGRVSLKARNADLDTPDAWETKVLTRFDERKAAGEPVETMAFGEIVEGNGKRQFRFMKAIPTGELCLTCHGSNIQPEVAALLDQAYPGDPARGYALGDVRGAFSVSKTLP